VEQRRLTLVEDHIVRVAVVLLERELARIVILDLAYSVRQLGPGVFDRGLGTELMLAAKETSKGLPSGADAAAVRVRA
jgi:hypothetical protein